jgi:hypothetical protein
LNWSAFVGGSSGHVPHRRLQSTTIIRSNGSELRNTLSMALPIVFSALYAVIGTTSSCAILARVLFAASGRFVKSRLVFGDSVSELHRLVVAGVRMRTLYQGNRYV